MRIPKQAIGGIIFDERGQGLVEYLLTITSISLLALINIHGIGAWLESVLGGI